MIRTKNIDCIFDLSLVKKLQEERYVFMLEVRSNGKVYLLDEHWKYLDWKKQTPRIAVETSKVPEPGYYYNYSGYEFHQTK